MSCRGDNCIQTMATSAFVSFAAHTHCVPLWSRHFWEHCEKCRVVGDPLLCLRNSSFRRRTGPFREMNCISTPVKETFQFRKMGGGSLSGSFLELMTAFQLCSPSMIERGRQGQAPAGARSPCQRTMNLSFPGCKSFLKCLPNAALATK